MARSMQADRSAAAGAGAGCQPCAAAGSRAQRLQFELESLQGRSIRGDVARAVVDSGWDLTELRPVALSLEEVFLQLTGTEPPPANE